ncbi:4'-phosphopantetheinyl transferase superfamily protein [Streptomyces sp. BH-SS-21]|uniref:4'-phosphopantetheinyl transferase superfamily protein n=1 Tax=Streptomyces liliiviolaceus TaxID=2823109 RepID=A0A940Y3Z0_9ACTN|nr:4'-phosphopantetheinyl transferase superfamily protein [Streptomyces liliiviolaceus]MBQ0852015.1 4'-phosphopantetheinyl transferase superfamily protein [Streptomyces liliiviolaceus]
MTLPGDSTVGPPLREPVEVLDRDDGWERVVRDLRQCGTALVHTRLADWCPEPEDVPEMRRLLGRDWSRHLDLARPETRIRHVAGRLLLKHAAGVMPCGDPEDLELGYGPAGRPYLRGCDQMDISLSHAEDRLLVGLTTTGLIGVDSQRADRQLSGPGASTHVCTPYELISLANLPEAERNPTLVRLRTLKEAYGKAIGAERRLRFTEFGFGPDGRPTQVHRPDGTPGTGAEWAFRTFLLPNGYCVGAAVYDAGFDGSRTALAREGASPPKWAGPARTAWR